MGEPLSLDRAWYRQLLVLIVPIAAVIGLLALGYIGITSAIGEAIFGDTRSTVWSGEWWWIPMTALGGAVVVALRQWWGVAAVVPGGVEIIESGHVDHRVAPSWIGIALVSAVAGASLGPSFALVIIGGGLASWVASRRWPGNEDARLDATTAGIAAGFGGAFTAPVLGAVIVSELEPIPRARYVEAIIPQLIGATIAFAVYFGIVGSTFLDLFAIPAPEFEVWHLGLGVGLGVLAALVLIIFAIVLKSIEWVAGNVTNHYVRGIVGGAIVGGIAAALPLTIGSGSDQLTFVVDESATIGVSVLLLAVVGKMIAMSISLSTGFVGGNVLPMLFVGGTAGAALHVQFPDLPYAITVGAMMAAVPGAYIRAPIGLTLLAALTIGLGALTGVPVAVAVVTAHLVIAFLRTLRVRRSPLHDTALRT